MMGPKYKSFYFHSKYTLARVLILYITDIFVPTFYLKGDYLPTTFNDSYKTNPTLCFKTNVDLFYSQYKQVAKFCPTTLSFKLKYSFSVKRVEKIVMSLKKCMCKNVQVKMYDKKATSKVKV